MSDSIEIDDLDKAIEETLRQEFTKIQGKIIARGRYIGRKTLKKIIEKSPKDSGDYAKGWRIKEVDIKDKTFGRYTAIIHNATSPQITHLLELGHGGGNGGTQRFKAYPHIRPAEEEAAKEYYEEIQKVLSED